MIETAFAKINLALHVRRRRDDGYHELETLFAFVDAGDRLTVEPAEVDRFTIGGEFGPGLSPGPDNLVIQALATMRAMVWPGSPPVPPLSIHLEKRLPVAAGIGGGSADAAAMIRLLDRHFVHNGDNKELILATRRLGADVGPCIVSQTRVGLGTGGDLHMGGANNVSGMACLLVNPRLPLATGSVFRQWDGLDRGPLPEGDLRSVMLAGRNDLTLPALELCPPIAEVLSALQATDPVLARMSGSGATCFALYDVAAARDAAALEIVRSHPQWWQLSGALR